MCRSRRELSNAYLLAKFGVDTEENEPRHLGVVVDEDPLARVPAVARQEDLISSDSPPKGFV